MPHLSFSKSFPCTCKSLSVLFLLSRSTAASIWSKEVCFQHDTTTRTSCASPIQGSQHPVQGNLLSYLLLSEDNSSINQLRLWHILHRDFLSLSPYRTQVNTSHKWRQISYDFPEKQHQLARCLPNSLGLPRTFILKKVTFKGSSSRSPSV